MKTVSRVKGPENRQELVQSRLRRIGLFKKKGFEFRVKLMRGQGKKRSRINSSDEWWRRRRLPQLFGKRIPKYRNMLGKRLKNNQHIEQKNELTNDLFCTDSFERRPNSLPCVLAHRTSPYHSSDDSSSSVLPLKAYYYVEFQT